MVEDRRWDYLEKKFRRYRLPVKLREIIRFVYEREPDLGYTFAESLLKLWGVYRPYKARYNYWKTQLEVLQQMRLEFIRKYSMIEYAKRVREIAINLLKYQALVKLWERVTDALTYYYEQQQYETIKKIAEFVINYVKEYKESFRRFKDYIESGKMFIQAVEELKDVIIQMYLAGLLTEAQIVAVTEESYTRKKNRVGTKTNYVTIGIRHIEDINNFFDFLDRAIQDPYSILNDKEIETLNRLDEELHVRYIIVQFWFHKF